MRVIASAVLAAAAAAGVQNEFPPDVRDAVKLGRTSDEALLASFHRGYSLAPSGVVDSAEIVTEFRRAVLIVREHAMLGEYMFGPRELTAALTPYRGLVTLAVQIRLHPLNTFVKPPLYEMYVSTGPLTPPVAAKPLKRDPVYPLGVATGAPMIAVRLEGSFPRAEVASASQPSLVVLDDRAELVWQARLDLARYR
jgi:hypothetical protein